MRPNDKYVRPHFLCDLRAVNTCGLIRHLRSRPVYMGACALSFAKNRDNIFNFDDKQPVVAFEINGNGALGVE